MIKDLIIDHFQRIVTILKCQFCTNDRFINPQAFVVAGGFGASGPSGPRLVLSSVLTLLPGSKAWTPLASLPRALEVVRASILAGALRVAGGNDNTRSSRSEVINVLSTD